MSKLGSIPAGPFPVFYDRSGKRLYRLVLAVLAVLALLGTALAILTPAALAPTRSPATNSDASWPRQFLGTGPAHTPVIGEGVLTRVLRVEYTHTGTGARPGPDPALLTPPRLIPAPDNDGDGIPDDIDGDGTPDGPQPAEQPDLPDPPPMSAVRLLDPVTGEFVRNAEDWEVPTIGNSPYVVEHLATAPDHTLILTFDDGPDAEWTPEILNILSREHVPATFFVVGKQVAKNPAIIDRMVREGHMVGNHTFTHIDFNAESDFRNREEVVGTDRAVRAVANYDTRLFRMPYGNPDDNPLGQLIGQQLGYLHVDFDLDTRDWEYDAKGEEVPTPRLDGRGHVVIMHDAGGKSRAATVAMLPKLIAEAKAQGYHFTTLAPILPPQYIPQHVPATIADHATLIVSQSAYSAPRAVLNAGSGSASDR